MLCKKNYCLPAGGGVANEHLLYDVRPWISLGNLNYQQNRLYYPSDFGVEGNFVVLGVGNIPHGFYFVFYRFEESSGYDPKPPVGDPKFTVKDWVWDNYDLYYKNSMNVMDPLVKPYDGFFNPYTYTNEVVTSGIAFTMIDADNSIFIFGENDILSERIFPGIIAETGSGLDPYENFVRNDYIFELSENDKVALDLQSGIVPSRTNFSVYLYKVETSEFEQVSFEW